jgi:hypothetical protein
MVEKISGVDAKNVEIAKNKDTDIDTIVKNLQRNVKKKVDEEKDREIRTGLPGDLTEEIPVDDIVNAELIEVEEDSPLNVAQTEGIAQSEAEQKELEGGTQTQGLTPIRLDRLTGEEGLFDLSGSSEPGMKSPFDLDPDKSYYDFETEAVMDPGDIDAAKRVAARDMFFTTDLPVDDKAQAIKDSIEADKGFPNIDVTQEQKFTDPNFYVNNPIEGQATAAGQGLVNTDGSPIMEQGPTPLFDSDIDEEAIRRAIEGKADGGQIFGNQNMSTFAKLKAIADGIADNK